MAMSLDALLGQGCAGERAGAWRVAGDRPKKRPLGITGDPGALKIIVQVGFKIVMAR